MTSTILPSEELVCRELHVKDGEITYEATQDCEPILEWAKEAHNTGAHGSSDMKLAARVPVIVIEKYCHDNGITYQQYAQDKEHWRRLLNAPENALFRVWKGRI